MNILKLAYRNASIRNKILIGSVVAVLFTLILGITSIININQISESYNNILEGPERRIYLMNLSINNITELKRSTNALIVNKFVFNDNNAATREEGSIKSAVAQLKSNLDEYKENIYIDININNERTNTAIESVDQVLSKVDAKYIESIDKVIEAINQDNIGKIKDKINEATTILNDIHIDVESMRDLTLEDISNIEAENNRKVYNVVVLSFAIMIIAFIVCVISAFLTANSISKPIKKLRNKANSISKGDFSVVLETNRKDELGLLANDISNVVRITNTLIGDIVELTQNIEKGNLNYQIDTSKFEGRFEVTASEVNNLCKTFIGDLASISECIEAIKLGDFEHKLPIMDGDKSKFNDILNGLTNNIISISKEINNFVNSARMGNLDIRINDESFEGDWKVIVQNMNMFVNDIAIPIEKVSNSLELIAAGNLNATIENSYYGEFGKMIDNINVTAKNLSAYINEISIVLNKMANKNFDVDIKNDYRGNFADIKVALNLIIKNLNELVKSIASSSDQIATSANSISASSTELADGTSHQASAVEELKVTITTVSEQIKENAQNAIIADNLANIAKNDAQSGNIEMTKMLNAMDEINKASTGISNIIKVIEDIAFQTNILALNAAVEAARAGQHGKGFSVVAEEVRNLAAKSQQSAKETTDLIQNSLDKVAQGIQIANNTAKTLEEISEHVNQITNVVSNVSKSSQEQDISMSQIMSGVEQISSVVINNSATSEEAASAAEELASQSEIFNNAISMFKLLK